MSRPDRLVVLAGTHTEVGKTWVAAALARALVADGRRVAARKPAQSFDPGDGLPTDADVLAAATGADAHDVCPPHRWYPAALAPPMAADVLGLAPIRVDDLVAELHWPAPLDVGLVETAGGLCSPIAHDGDGLALVARLDADVVVLVADPALGVLSHVRLATRALDGRDVVVLLNRFDAGDELHVANRDWLRDVDGLAVETSVQALARRMS